MLLYLAMTSSPWQPIGKEMYKALPSLFQS